MNSDQIPEADATVPFNRRGDDATTIDFPLWSLSETLKCTFKYTAGYPLGNIS